MRNQLNNPGLTLLLFVLCAVMPVFVLASVEVKKPPELSMQEFIQQASANDDNFERILIDQLPLQYRRSLLLPESDVIVDIKHQHNFYLDQDRSNPETTISLGKLFPLQGTEVSMTYNKASTRLSRVEDSSLQFLISQPIAKNAFGKDTRLLDKIIGIENDISRYQIIEAYEDYLASLSIVYYNWYSAYENLRVGKLSYSYNEKLLEDILDRQRQKIALPVDVNKMKLLLIGKKENIIVLQEVYDTYSNYVHKAIAYEGVNAYVPVKPIPPASQIEFEADYKKFTEFSRTYKVLQKLERQGTLEVEKAAANLLPSTNLQIGYRLSGEDRDIKDDEDTAFAGITLTWPVGRSVTKAKQRIVQIEYEKTLLSNENKYADLRVNLKNLYIQIEREQKLIDIARTKSSLSEAILEDETENYSYGKVTINDYIDAVNRVDDNHFSYTEHTVNLNKLFIEWLRLTDQLVDNNLLEEKL